MSNINVPYNSDLTPTVFPIPVFINAEIPTSEKFNQLGIHIDRQFGILAEIIGNSFLHGLPNLSASVGDLKKLTQFSSAVGVTPALLDPANLYFNESQATISGPNINGLYTVTFAGTKVLSSNNIVQNPDTSFSIVNVAIATKDNNGNINQIFPGSFTPITGYLSGDVSQFMASFGDAITPGSNFFVLATNRSIVDVLVETVKNIGDVRFSSTLYGALDGSNSPAVASSGAPVTNEIDSIEDHPFAVRWHARLLPGTYTSITAGVRTWTVTSADSTKWTSGSYPTPADVKKYLTSPMVSSLVIPANASSATSISVMGAPVTSPSPTPTVDFTSGNINIHIDNTLVTRFGSNPIDVYFSAKVPFRLLQLNNLNYSDEGSRIIDLVTKVIGTQYGYTQTTFPNTIANRLDTDETAISNLTTLVNAVSGFVIPNGSFEYSSDLIHPDLWTLTKFDPSIPTPAIDTTTFFHGAQSLKFSVTAISGGFGGGSAETLYHIPASPHSSYYVQFKIKSPTAGIENKVVLEFFQGDGVTPTATNSSITIWSSSAAIPSFASFAGKVLASSLDSGTRFMKVKLVGGSLASSASGSVWFDGVEFFAPSAQNKVAFFTTPGSITWTAPSNCITAKVLIVAAGGGGGDDVPGISPLAGAGGGGAGGLHFFTMDVVPYTSYTGTIGTGGATATSGGLDGAPGGDTTFNGITANGGQGGHGAIAAVGGTGGTTPGYDYDTVLASAYGNTGGTKTGNTGGYGASLAVGQGIWPFGVATVPANTNGIFPGGGAGGSSNGSSAATSGGNGIVVIYY